MLPAASPARPRLVFVDTETTGLDPATDRVIEIAVVTVDGDTVDEWTTLLNPRTPRALSSRLIQEVGEERARSLPRFNEVAQSLLQRIGSGRLIAHNARFDYAFLQAEFARAGIRFEAEIVCSVALSKRLYGGHDRHDLASLVARHRLDPGTRHRALPDARALFQLWQAFHRDHAPSHIDTTIRDLLAAPLLPAGLDAALIDRLPEKPGVYVLHGNGRALHVGRAGNLRLRLVNYFRLDRISKQSASWANAIENISWQVASGDLGARLQRAAVAKAVLPAHGRRGAGETFAWRFDPQARPAVALIPLADGPGSADTLFGTFQTARKGCNALMRLAQRHRLCSTLLGLPVSEDRTCAACRPGWDGAKEERLRHLTQAYTALLPWKIAPWPCAGPIAIRERRHFHVAHRWRYLGTARNMQDVHALLESRPPPFDAETYSVLRSALSRLPRRRVVPLSDPAAPGQ